MRPRGTLLAQIERDAVDNFVPLSKTLRNCVILAGQIGTSELRVWASRELNGYAPEDHDELPTWRKVQAPLQIDGLHGRMLVRGQTVSRYFLPDFAREHITEEVVVFWGVGELETMIRNADENVIRLGPYMASDLVTYINAKNSDPYQHIERLYWAVGVTTLQGVLDRVRTALIERVAELHDRTPDQVEMSPVTGKIQDGQGQINTVTVVAPRRDAESPTQRRWNMIAVWLGVAAGIAGAIFTLLQLLE